MVVNNIDLIPKRMNSHRWSALNANVDWCNEIESSWLPIHRNGYSWERFMDDLESCHIRIIPSVVGSIVHVERSNETIESVLDISSILKWRLQTCPWLFVNLFQVAAMAMIDALALFRLRLLWQRHCIDYWLNGSEKEKKKKKHSVRFTEMLLENIHASHSFCFLFLYLNFFRVWVCCCCLKQIILWLRRVGDDNWIPSYSILF